jgi:hypothetical protein
VHYEKDGQHDENADLENAEHGAEHGRGADTVKAGGEHDERAENRPGPPEVRRIARCLGVDRRGRGEPQLQQDEWSDEQPGEYVSPCGQEAETAVKPLSDVGRERPGRGHVLGQFTDAEGA